MKIQKLIIRNFGSQLDNVFVVSDGEKVGLVSIPDRAGNAPDTLDTDGLLSLGGAVITPPQWEEIRAYLCFDPDDAALKDVMNSGRITCNYYVLKDGRWGILNEAGRVIQAPLYDEVIIAASGIQESFDFRDIGNVPDRFMNMDLLGGCVTVRLGAHWGMLRGQGRVILPVIYDSIDAVDCCMPFELVYTVRGYGSCGVVDEDGKFLIPMIYPSLDCDGLEYVKFFSVYRIDSETGTGYVRLGDGKCLVTPEWERVDRSRLYLPGDEEPAGHIFTVWKDGHCGLIFDDRGMIIPPVWDEIIPRRLKTSDPLSYSVRRGKYWGCYDAKGNLICDAVWDEVGILINGIACVRKHDRWGVIGADGQLCVPVEWDEIEGFGITNAEYHLKVNTNMAIVMVRNRKIVRFLPDCFSWVRRNGLWGLVDSDGTVIVEPVWETHDRTSACKLGPEPMELQLCVDKSFLEQRSSESDDEPDSDESDAASVSVEIKGTVLEEKTFRATNGTLYRIVIQEVDGSNG